LEELILIQLFTFVDRGIVSKAIAQQKVANFDEADDECKVGICSIAFTNVLAMLHKDDLENLTVEVLDDLKNFFRETAEIFYTLRGSPITNELKIEDIIILTHRAHSFLLEASSTFKRAGQTQIYYESLLKSGHIIRDILEYISVVKRE
jgi:hypothetical protein